MRSPTARSASGSSRRATGASGSVLALAVGAALAAAFPPPAHALFSDTVEVWAAGNITRDSNVFRISDEAGPSAIGASSLSDTIETVHLGVTANVPISQQRLEAAYTWHESRFRRFSELDNSGHSARGVWHWSYDHRITGTLGYNESEALSSFANIQRRARDVVTGREAFFTGAWLFTPRWRGNVGATATEARHTDEPRRINDIDARSAEVGLSYLTPKESSVGVLARFERGENPRTTTLEGVEFDNAYRQAGVGVGATWAASGHSRLEGQALWTRRKYDQFTQRDYSGPAFRVLYTWTPTGKLTIDMAALRDIGPADEVTTSFVLVKGAYVRPKWTVTEKVTVLANLEFNDWDYKADPFTGESFSHKQRLFGASVEWRPTRTVLIQAGASREKRTSTLLFGDYEVDVAFVEGRFGF